MSNNARGAKSRGHQHYIFGEWYNEKAGVI
jgi:hypothetical protein